MFLNNGFYFLIYSSSKLTYTVHCYCTFHVYFLILCCDSVCCFFGGGGWWKGICTSFLLFVFSCIAHGDPIIKSRRVGLPLTSLISPHCCDWSKQRWMDFHRHIWSFCFQWFDVEGRVDVDFVDIGGTFDHAYTPSCL